MLVLEGSLHATVDRAVVSQSTHRHSNQHVDTFVHVSSQSQYTIILGERIASGQTARGSKLAFLESHNEFICDPDVTVFCHWPRVSANV
jgi:hypothetical protein